MKLFLISQSENSDSLNTFDSAVVAAKDDAAARLIVPGKDGGYKSSWENYDGSWCSTPDKVTVRYIGEAADDVPEGVVLSSFNAA